MCPPAIASARERQDRCPRWEGSDNRSNEDRYGEAERPGGRGGETGRWKADDMVLRQGEQQWWKEGIIKVERRGVRGGRQG